MSKSMRRDKSSRKELPQAGISVLLLLAVATGSIAGCSSGGKTPIGVGPISFTDSNGMAQPAPTSLTAGATAYVEITLTADTALLGADWGVACGSALPPGTPLPPGVLQDTSCGTFTPVHTASGPVPAYATSGAGIVTLFTAPAAPPKEGVVTLYAAATGDHSRYSSVTIPIAGAPISIQFGSVSPSSIPVSGTAAFKAVLTNDYVAGGASWSVNCGASSCGSFSPAKTASGVATTYQAPTSVPPGGVVIITATSVTDPTKAVSANISIVPVTVSVAAELDTVGLGDTDLITATVANDVSNAGVDWTVSCASGADCGAISQHTASGIAATYTAPATVPAGASVTVQATSTADKSAHATTTLTIDPLAAAIRGRVQSGLRPVAGASVSLYSAGTRGNGSEALPLEQSPGSRSDTDDSGNFLITLAEPCRNPGDLLFLVSRGGDAGAGENPNLTLVLPLGRCGASRSMGPVIVNEVTTTVSAYALAAFTRDALHVGAAEKNHAGLEKAMNLTAELVDPRTGMARAKTPDNAGTVPRDEIDALADILNACANTRGGNAGDGSPCGQFFAAAGGSFTKDTMQAMLYLAHHSEHFSAVEWMSAMEWDTAPFKPIPQSPLSDWRLGMRFDRTSPALRAFASNPAQAGSAGSFIDIAGNLWVLNTDGLSITEFIGAGSGGPEPLNASTNGMQ